MNLIVAFENVQTPTEKPLTEKAIRLIQAHDRAVSQWASEIAHC
ncbi:MAG: hypothetical protein ACI84R_000868 [Candidatus Azotimanducaceae bacterium]|jgi:hypothetical protein